MTSATTGRRALLATAVVAPVLAIVVHSAAVAAGADAAGGARIGRNTVVFQSVRDGNEDIYAVDPSGTGLRRLTTDPAPDSAPGVSPDRSAVVMASERHGNSDIYLLRVGDGSTTRLTFDDRFDFHPVFSHDGETILFQRMTDGFFDLWVMAADGDGARKLTTLPLNEVGGVYAPDDSLIAFMGNNGGNRDIRVMQADGTVVVNVTSGWCVDGSTGAGCILSQEIMPAWTPDGRIVFVSDRSGSPQLWIMDANGSDASQLTHLAGVNGHPSVSANGKTIAFNLDGSLATVQLDGTGVHRLTATEDYGTAYPY